MPKKLSHEFVKNCFQQRGYKLKDYYKNNKTPMNYICCCGHELRITFSNFMKGHQCRICSRSTKIPFDNKLYRAIYYQNNKERIKEEKRKYWSLHKDRLLIERKSKYNTAKHQMDRRKRSEKTAYRFAEGIRGAKKRNVNFIINIQEYESIIADGICHYCEKPLEKTGCGLDRKDNNIGYILENCVPCCRRCNVTFNNLYNYEGKLILAEAIKKIDLLQR